MANENIAITSKITDEQRDNVIRLSDLGLKGTEIAKILLISETTVATIVSMAKAVKDDDWDSIKRITGYTKSQVTLNWALKKYNKSIPEPKPEPVPLIPKMNVDMKPELNIDGIKTVVAEAIAENCKGHIEQIDKDQMGRIMLAMGRITDALADISLKLEDFQKTQNANADSIYALLTSMNNSIIMELKKRK